MYICPLVCVVLYNIQASTGMYSLRLYGTDGERWICDVYQRVCRLRIGLWSHARVHR